MTAGRRLAAPLAVAAATLAALACGGGSSEAPAPGAASDEKAVEQQPEEASVEPLQRKEVEVYFPSALDNGLVGEFREIFDTASPGDRAKQIIADLISGPSSEDALRALPTSTRLRQVFVVPGGTAYLDFASGLTESAAGGSMRELLTIYSIVDSVALNIPEIGRVAILINGQPVETLSGHVDLRRPLPPDYRMILGSITVEGPGATDDAGVAVVERRTP